MLRPRAKESVMVRIPGPGGLGGRKEMISDETGEVSERRSSHTRRRNSTRTNCIVVWQRQGRLRCRRRQCLTARTGHIRHRVEASFLEFCDRILVGA